MSSPLIIANNSQKIAITEELSMRHELRSEFVESKLDAVIISF